MRVSDRGSLEGVLEGTHHTSFVAGNSDDAAAARHLEDAATMVGYHHELGQHRITQDRVARQDNVSNVKFDDLSAVVATCDEGDGNADMPKGNSRTTDCP